MSNLCLLQALKVQLTHLSLHRKKHSNAVLEQLRLKLQKNQQDTDKEEQPKMSNLATKLRAKTLHSLLDLPPLMGQFRE